MAKLPELIDYYQERYASPPGAMRNYAAYLKLLDIRPGTRIVDIGCGEGHLLAEAKQVGLVPLGVEIAMTALRLARQHIPGVPLVLAAGEALPFAAETFDVVTCLGSLEHFSDPLAGAREIARILRKEGGVALIVVPNRRFLGWRLLGKSGTEQQEVSELLLDREEWVELLAAAGLQVSRVAKDPWHTKPRRSWVHLLGLYSAWHLIPLRWTYQFAFVCRSSR